MYAESYRHWSVPRDPGELNWCQSCRRRRRSPSTLCTRPTWDWVTPVRLTGSKTPSTSCDRSARAATSLVYTVTHYNCQRVVNVWNSLPVSIVNFISFNSFNRALQNVNLSIFTIVWIGGICFSLFFTFYFLLYFFDRHHVRGYCPVVTCSLEITVSALYIAMLSANKWNERQ